MTLQSVPGPSSLAVGRFTDAQRLELEYWKTSELEGPDSEFLRCMVEKIAEFGPVFLDAMENHFKTVGDAPKILELGGGQGWASCMVKARLPDAHVVATDISPRALVALPKWQSALDVCLDEAVSCVSDDLPFADKSFDVIFTFASAHHFRNHKRTLAEISRVLRDGGKCFYFYEPSCHPAIYRFALWRVERKRPTPPEDVLRYSEIKRLAQKVGLDCTVTLNLSLRGRGPLQTLYYAIFRMLPQLLWFLPCSMDYRFVKPG